MARARLGRLTMLAADGNRKSAATPSEGGQKGVATPNHSDKPLMLPAPEIPVSPSAKQEPKRTKATVMMFEKEHMILTGSKNPPNACLAGSHGESRHAQ